MTRPRLSGLHHVSLPVQDLSDAIAWFQSAFGAVHLTELDHLDPSGNRFGAVVRVPGVAPVILLRHSVDIPAMGDLTFEVADRAELERWLAHFDALDLAHSDVMVGRGTVMTAPVPGGPALMLYVNNPTEHS